MSMSVGSTSNYTNTQRTENFAPINSVSKEVDKLVEEGLIGENSQTSMQLDFESVTISYWSNKDNAQWQAYESANTDIAQTAANYHLQMIHERQEIADSYLTDFLNLANTLEDSGLHDYSLSEVLELPVTQKVDDSLRDFLDKNEVIINELKHKYTALQEYPRDLLSWLDDQQIETNNELSNFIKSMEHEWANGNFSDDIDIPEGYTSRTSSFDLIESSFEISSEHTIDNPMTKFDRVMLESAQSWASLGDQSQLIKYIAAPRALSEYRNDIYQQLMVYSNSLSAQDAQQFHTDEISFSVHNMIENYSSGNPITLLSNGETHPDAEFVNEFWENNKLLIDQYLNKREELENLPKTAIEFRESYYGLVQKYTHEHFNELMSLKPKER